MRLSDSTIVHAPHPCRQHPSVVSTTYVQPAAAAAHRARMAAGRVACERAVVDCRNEGDDGNKLARGSLKGILVDARDLRAGGLSGLGDGRLIPDADVRACSRRVPISILVHSVLLSKSGLSADAAWWDCPFPDLLW